jgi:hypothetical protein
MSREPSVSRRLRQTARESARDGRRGAVGRHFLRPSLVAAFVAGGGRKHEHQKMPGLADLRNSSTKRQYRSSAVVKSGASRASRYTVSEPSQLVPPVEKRTIAVAVKRRMVAAWIVVHDVQFNRGVARRDRVVDEGSVVGRSQREDEPRRPAQDGERCAVLIRQVAPVGAVPDGECGRSPADIAPIMTTKTVRTLPTARRCARTLSRKYDCRIAGLEKVKVVRLLPAILQSCNSSFRKRWGARQELRHAPDAGRCATRLPSAR